MMRISNLSILLLPALLAVLGLAACTENPGMNIAGSTPRARILAAEGLDSPSAMAFDQRGNLYVAEEEVGRIVCISPDGSHAVLARGLDRPCALCVDRDNNLVVAEGSGRLIRIAPDGVISELKPGQL